MSTLSSILDDFKGYYGDFLEVIENLESPEEEKKYLKRVVTYNLSGGKRIRGALVPAAMEAFEMKNPSMKCHMREAHLVGWCIELIHAGFLILDDIIDGSTMRRGKPSWFRTQEQAGYGLIAVNDGLHLVLTSKYILHSIFGARASLSRAFVRLLRLFDEVAYKTCWGQALDTLYSRSIDFNTDDSYSLELDMYSRQNFDNITRWKTGFYTFYLPVACGMALAGVESDDSYEQAKCVLLKLGQYFQAQDDFLDCFGDPKITGKEGTDIVDGKCSWLIVECLSRASESQRQIIKQNYGRKDKKAEAAVVQVFEELDLRSAFREYEKQLNSEIEHNISSGNHTESFCNLLKEINQMLFLRNR